MHGRVGHSQVRVPWACLICLAYYGLMLAEEVGTMLRVDIVRHIEG